MTFKIDKGIPVPTFGRKGFSKFPFPSLKIGDSFFVPIASYKNETTCFCSVGACAYRYKKKNGGDFTARQITEDGIAGVRVWRIE